MRIPSLSDIPDLGPVEEGEYELRIKKGKDTISGKTNRPGIMLSIEVVEEPLAETIFETLWFPMEGDDPDKAQTMWRMIKEFMTNLGMDTSVENGPEDFTGIEFRALLGLEDDQNDRPVNVIKRIL